VKWFLSNVVLKAARKKGFLKSDTVPIDWTGRWYCLHHRGNSPFTTKLQDPPHQMPKPIVHTQPEITIPSVAELNEAFGIEEVALTVQQEADLDQAAHAWVQEMKLVVNAIQGPNEEKIGDIVAEAMKASCLEQIKEIKRLRREVFETSEHLGKVTEQGAIIANHLSLQTQLADEAAKALDVMSRQTCKCDLMIDFEGEAETKHSEGCSTKISSDALAAMKELMEKVYGE